MAFGAWRCARTLPDPSAGTDAGAVNPYMPIDDAGVTLVAQALDVDGVTNVVRPASGEAPVLEVGTFVDVEIVDALDYDLVAEVRA